MNWSHWMREVVAAQRTPRLPPPAPGKRVVVVGTSGVGKSTLARILAARWGCDRVELDAEFWLPGWQMRPRDEVRARVAARLDAAGSSWVVDGNYLWMKDMIWTRAQTVVWLDYALGRTMWQVTRRTMGRILRRELLWGTNREELAKALGRDSILRWAWTTWGRRRLEYATSLGHPLEGLQVIQLREPRETARWLAARVPR